MCPQETKNLRCNHKVVSMVCVCMYMVHQEGSSYWDALALAAAKSQIAHLQPSLCSPLSSIPPTQPSTRQRRMAPSSHCSPGGFVVHLVLGRVGAGGGEVADRPSPAASLLAVVAQAADPAFDSAAPDGFFIALSAYEAGTDIEFLAHKGWVLGVGCPSATNAVTPSDTFIVFKVVEAGKGVFVFV
jgi:hypothetical protein